MRNLKLKRPAPYCKKWSLKPTSMGTIVASDDAICSRDFVERAPQSVEVGVQMKSQCSPEPSTGPDLKEAKVLLEGLSTY
jgi:hypothetical protein